MKSDYLEKTEPATTKRVADARKKGVVSHSRDLATSLFLVAAILAFYGYSTTFFEKWLQILSFLFQNLNTPLDSQEIITHWTREGITQFLLLLFPFFFLFAILAALSHLWQTQWIVNLDQIKPKWDRINPFQLSHLTNRFNWHAFYRLLIGYVRLGIVLMICWVVCSNAMKEIVLLPRMDAIDLLTFIVKKGYDIAVWSSLSLLVIGVLDWIVQKLRISEKLSMSKQELKEELKMTEGNPSMKTRRKSLMRDLFISRGSGTLDKAHLLIAGLGMAVAIRYDATVMDIPICLKKGVRRNSEKMLEEAKSIGLKIVYDASLAASICEHVELGQCVRPEHYQVVAEALSHEFK